MFVFNINLCVFDSLSAIRHERELSLVLTCHVTDAFYVRSSDVCAQKIIYQKLKLIWFKTHDFSMIWWSKPNRCSKPNSPILESHLHLKRHYKTVCFCFNSKYAFSKWYNKWSVGYFELKLHRHILGTPEIYITSCKKGHRSLLRFLYLIKNTVKPVITVLYFNIF